MFNNRAFPVGPVRSNIDDDDAFDDLASIDSSATRSKHRHKSNFRTESTLNKIVIGANRRIRRSCGMIST